MLGFYVADEAPQELDMFTGMPKAFHRVLPMGSDGRRVTRTKQTHPWSYDEFVKWKAPGGLVEKSGTYSDRLYQQDSKKHDELCLKHFGNKGQYWDQRSPAKIEAFLIDYLDCFEDVKLVRICEGCNQATGYPYWRFDYTYTRQKPEEKAENSPELQVTQQ
jgi:hypothetical protein